VRRNKTALRRRQSLPAATSAPRDAGHGTFPRSAPFSTVGFIARRERKSLRPSHVKAAGTAMEKSSWRVIENLDKDSMVF
jgi:hypothetical protein